MKLLVFLVVCCHFYNPVFCFPNNFNNDTEVKNDTSGNFTSLEQRLTLVERKTSLLIGKVYKLSKQVVTNTACFLGVGVK